MTIRPISSGRAHILDTRDASFLRFRIMEVIRSCVGRSIRMGRHFSSIARCAPCGSIVGLPSTAVMITAYMVTTIPTAAVALRRAHRARAAYPTLHTSPTPKIPHKLFRPFFALNSGNTLSPRLLSILTFSLPNIVAANFPRFFCVSFLNSKFRQFREGREGVNVLNVPPNLLTMYPKPSLQGCKMYPKRIPKCIPTSFVSTIG